METLLGLVLLLVIAGGVYVLFVKRRDTVNQGEQLAAGMNFDLENVVPFFEELSQVLDQGFTGEQIDFIQSEIEGMKKDHELNEIGTFPVSYKGAEAEIRIVAEIHIEDDLKEVVLTMYSSPEVVRIIDQEMMRFVEEREM
ncbi:hypothetical protein J7I80_15460 [Bacillus sp. ISL-41]|uniref:hypothetical protein n=1 Tax=Bacillus sp. ISL-41 TaxID=2819127 RepID=UPI001BE72A7B|nr:hypothetical protein [Bacillus sp. ISL-41]MBT2643639.1 hypothetical protein [Bacillus sp. ISL-41]